MLWWDIRCLRRRKWFAVADRIVAYGERSIQPVLTALNTWPPEDVGPVLGTLTKYDWLHVSETSRKEAIDALITFNRTIQSIQGFRGDPVALLVRIGTSLDDVALKVSIITELLNRNVNPESLIKFGRHAIGPFAAFLKRSHYHWDGMHTVDALLEIGLADNRREFKRVAQVLKDAARSNQFQIVKNYISGRMWRLKHGNASLSDVHPDQLKKLLEYGEFSLRQIDGLEYISYHQIIDAAKGHGNLALSALMFAAIREKKDEDWLYALEAMIAILAGPKGNVAWITTQEAIVATLGAVIKQNKLSKWSPCNRLFQLLLPLARESRPMLELLEEVLVPRVQAERWHGRTLDNDLLYDVRKRIKEFGGFRP